jgi:hypothetical protein
MNTPEIMRNEDIIYRIEIPNYPAKIKLSEKQRAKYYVKGKGKKVPKKYQNDKYEFNKGILTNIVTGEKVIANPRTAGTPKLWNVNFQAIWNQQIKYQPRAVITQKLKGVFAPFIKPLKPITEFPIRFELFIFDIDMPVDVSNKGVVYTKIIEDLLTEYKIIPDDKAEFINDTGRCKWVKVSSQEEIRMIIRISKSNNKMI